MPIVHRPSCTWLYFLKVGQIIFSNRGGGGGGGDDDNDGMDSERHHNSSAAQRSSECANVGHIGV